MIQTILDTARAIMREEGVAGGVWKVGLGESTATIQMDALDFNIFASGRFNYAEGRAKATLSGDVAPDFRLDEAV